MASAEADVAARLIERLLADPAFRAHFRRDPAAACREAGLDELAEEMAVGAGKAMYTLDMRESKSSLAGVMMAAAMEGVGIYQFTENVLPHLEEVPGHVADVLSRVDLPAIKLPNFGGGAAGGGSAAAAAVPQAADGVPGGESPPDAADAAGASPAGTAGAAAAPGAPSPSASPPEADGKGVAASGGKADAAAPPGGDVTAAPKASSLVDASPGKAAHAAAPPEARYVPDPAMYGASGTGGAPSPEAAAVLKDPNITLDANGEQDLGSGKMDPRTAAIMLALAKDHKLTISSTFSDHPASTAGGSVSNHTLGRGFDIATIDGQPVNSGSPVAREVAAALSELDPSIRPTEVGTPFPISAPGYFTDAGHQDHIHVAFDDPITNDYKTPPGLLASDPAAPPEAAPAPATAAAPAPVAAAAVATEPPPKPKTGSQAFLKAVTAETASKRKGGDSQAFLKAVEPPKAAAAAPPPARAAAAAAEPGAPAADLASAPTSYPVAEQAAPAPAGGGGSSLGAAALSVAQSQRGVRETGGANTGPQVDQFLAAAKVAPGNPWCASFVTWSLEQAGHKMPGGGWAAVSTWVRNAEQGNGGLKVVSAEEARPGDIVAYDWGGQDDFGADGHIGFLDSNVKDGQFTALEGNNNDAVNVVPRHLGGGPKIVFIRVDGNAQPAAAVPVSAPAVAEQAAPSGGTVDPSQFGAEGTGGAASAEALALLKNKNVVLDSDGVSDIKAGRIDPRVIGVIAKLSHEHKITISCMCSDHSKFTAGGSVSNHHFGRGADIAAIDGQPVGPGNPIAREIASELSTLDPSIRPNEIGSPWAIAGPGYFTDAAHQNHLHIGFKEEIPKDFTPPADVAAPGATPAVAGVAAAGNAAAAPAGVAAPDAAAPPAPAAPGDPAAAPPPKTGSQSFLKAVTAEAAAKDRAARGDSMAFLKAVEPPKAAAAAAPAAGALSPAVAEAAAAAFSGGGPVDYPGDDAPREQIAAWMAAQAHKRGLPPELPVMASLVESGMKNLHYGDADSVGFYQMRVGVWNQGDYAGYPDKPELQVKWFLDQAEAVKEQRLAAGKPIDDPNQYGDWIADVERPAEQYRGRYQLKLEEAQGLLKNAQPAAPAAPAAAAADPAAAAATAAAVSGAKLPPEIAKPLSDAIAAGQAPGPKALKAIEEASKYVGTPYHWGGSTPQTGFDCSGLMQWSYAQAGIQTPRVTYDQIDAPNAAKVPDMADLRPGDMVFFSNAGDVHHVGMYLGDHQFLHAPSTGDVVKVSSLDEPYFKSQFAGGRRFDQGAPAAAAPAAAPVAAAAAVPPAAPPPDPTEVANAQAQVARDAAEVRRNDSQLFRAITAEEARKQKHSSVMFLKAVQPDQVKPAAAAAPAPPAPATAPPEPAAAARPEAPAPAAPELSAAASVDLPNAATAYPGDTASQAELAKWLAAQAQKAGLPPELPVMASLVESGVKNLSFGDADSVGFFQMRVGIWNQGEYAGYPDKPELQAKWFIDHALEVKRKAIAAGDPNFGTDPSTFGEWIADVERPAEQFRGRYQLRLGEARKLLS
ncbi:NHLP-related RiPP peptide [Candidatus Solirubrobacter pratensis]|uniref:NHLP-related RiPP peptide n=1 Tax=Candidatus Solirubrobacter pratensis TaxID=1298857 RepID=UPI00040E2637|nr:NHLP-related RiPP peptide [Candidatus Solirubrobacter pratensis]